MRVRSARFAPPLRFAAESGLFWLLGLLVVLAAAPAAHAHGVIGKRFFPATLANDDPFVADELSLPTVSYLETPATGDDPATKETAISAELSKRLTPDLGLSLGGTFLVLAPDGENSVSGFDNLEVGAKYVFLKSPEHEALLSLGLGWDVGGTGSRQVGAESFHTLAPALFFGKGLGDLPESLALLKPIAVTGLFGVAIPTRGRTTTATVSVAQWGVSVEYNLQYLQSFVRDIGLAAPLDRMIPLVEFSMETPVDGPDSGETTGTINPGILWFGRYLQLGIEAQVPVNDRTARHVGVLAQIHFYLDDIAPEIFTWTPWHGVLGPTQPR